MDQVTSNMAELSGHVSAMAGLARGLSSAASAPLTGLAAILFGLRRAIGVRRALQVAAVAHTAPQSTRAAVPESPARAAITGRPGR